MDSALEELSASARLGCFWFHQLFRPELSDEFHFEVFSSAEVAFHSPDKSVGFFSGYFHGLAVSFLLALLTISFILGFFGRQVNIEVLIHLVAEVVRPEHQGFLVPFLPGGCLDRPLVGDGSEIVQS